MDCQRMPIRCVVFQEMYSAQAPFERDEIGL
jgi:hypothetical protein